MTSTQPGGRSTPAGAPNSITADPQVRRGPRSRLKTIAALGTAVAGLAALAVTQASPASADPVPTVTYAAVGAQTTQDVIDTFAGELSLNMLGSWDAFNPTTGSTHDLIKYVELKHNVSCSFTRPNGSIEGENAFRKSVNPATTAPQLAFPPQQNCIDIARSSVGPGTDQKADGQLVFIPFALDAVTTAVGPGASATFASDVNRFTTAQLTALYSTGGTVTGASGTVYNPQTPTGTQVAIHLYIPQPGSGTLKFWASKTGAWNAAAPPAWDHQTILAGPNTGTQVEQNDGTAVNSDPAGIMPFSIAQWIAQSNSATLGITDRRHGAVLKNINGVFPCVSGTTGVACPASGGTMNTAFPFTREVYNIVQYDQVVNTGDGHFDPNLAGLLVGTGSTLCQDSFDITGYGFAELSASTTDLCGSTANTLRAFDKTDPV